MSGSSPRWIAESPDEAEGFTRALLARGASLFQLPYWNEPLRALRFTPVYLRYRAAGDTTAFACVLRFGPPGARVGLVQRGPVVLDQGVVAHEAVDALASWAGRHGYLFLRVTNPSSAVLDRVASHPRATVFDPFPFYRDPQEQLLVDQTGRDDDVLARFQPLARRKIRKAEAESYRITRSDDPAVLVTLWPLFRRLADRKRFSFRPLDSYIGLMRRARPYSAAWVYAAYLGDRPVEAIVVVRDSATAYYISGALDVEALGGAESPSALLHWRAMRDLAREGAGAYDLGTRSGAVYQFKRIFRPDERRHPAPVTLVTNRVLYPLWTSSVLRVRGAAWRRVKSLASRFPGATSSRRVGSGGA